MEVRGKLIKVSRPYYQVKSTHAKQCVSFVIRDAKGRNRFFSVSQESEVKLIMISEIGDEMLLRLYYSKECSLFHTGHRLQSIENLTIGQTTTFERVGKQRFSGRLVRISRAFCLTDSFYHGEHCCVQPEIIVRAVFVIEARGKKLVAETTKMEVIQFLQMADKGDALMLEFGYLGDVSYIRNKRLRLTYRDLHR